MSLRSEDLKGQRVALTDDGSGGEQEADTPEHLAPAADKPLRDSALPCIAITALLAAFAVVAVLVGGIVTAAFSQPATSPPSARSANQTLHTAGPAASRAEGGSSRTLDARRMDVTWKVRHEEGGGGAWKAACFDARSGRALSWSDAIDALADGRLGAALSAQLLASPHAQTAFFWETPPLTLASAAAVPFEMVTIAAPGLASVLPDARPFASHIGGCGGSRAVKAFPNLGGDATLVVPCDADPSLSGSSYASIAPFVRGAPADQQERLWAKLGSTLRATLRERGEQPTWVSTEGSGVSWLHVRLDRTPKYFHHEPYTRPPPPAPKAAASRELGMSG